MGHIAAISRSLGVFFFLLSQGSTNRQQIQQWEVVGREIQGGTFQAWC
jgi:hypothetical protein